MAEKKVYHDPKSKVTFIPDRQPISDKHIKDASRLIKSAEKKGKK
jgi:hypothetical protein